jgi:hypothetical protein
MKQLVLEKICDICNIYEIMPSKAIQIFNNTTSKRYINDENHALKLTERYIKNHYGKKIRYEDSFVYNERHQSIRKRYWVDGC